MKPALIFFLAVIITATACTKPEAEEPAPQQQNYQYRIAHIQSRNDTLYRGVRFSYNDKNVVSKVVISDTLNTPQLVKSTETTTIEYIYDGDQITEEHISSSVKGKSYAKYTVGNLSKLLIVDYSKTPNGSVGFSYSYFHNNDSVYKLEVRLLNNIERLLQPNRNDTTEQLESVDIRMPDGKYRTLYSELVMTDKVKYAKLIPGLKNPYPIFKETPEFFSQMYISNYAVLDDNGQVVDRVGKSTQAQFDSTIEKETKTWGNGTETTYYTLEQYIP